MRTLTTLVVAVLALLTAPAAAATCTQPAAHRGVHNNTVDEDSLTSIARMRGRGAAEIDVHITADGYPVLMHDAAVNRTTNGTGLVSDLTLKQIRSLRLEKSGDQVPTFGEAIRTAERVNVPLIVDLKQYPQWSVDLLTRVGSAATNADVRVYLGGSGPFATAVPKYTRWVYWRPKGVALTLSNAAEYGADMIMDKVGNWTRSTVAAAETSGYVTAARLTDRYQKANRLGLDYALTNHPRKALMYCRTGT